MLVMEQEAARAGRRAVDDAVERLARERIALAARVDRLVGQGWSGVAADALTAAWRDWHEAAARLEQALAVRAARLAEVHAHLAATDAAAADGLAPLATRLGR